MPSGYGNRTGTPSGCAGGLQSGGFTPNQYLTGYDFGPLHAANVNGQGETVALIEIDGFKDSDINAFAQCFGLPVPALNAYGVGEISHPLPPGGEATLDLEVLDAAAPALKRIDVYESSATPANTLIDALSVSLKMIKNETIEKVWKRTHGCAEAVRLGAKALGFELFSKQPADSVTAVRYPAGITDKDFRNTLKNKHNIHIAGGQGTMEGQIFRVNHMGYSDAYDALAVVAAIEHVLKALGRPVNFGAGVAATQKVLTELF